MYKVKLVKLTLNHNNLRTTEVEGHCENLPELGKSFIMDAPPLESGDIRIIATSEVMLRWKSSPNIIHFNTMNSQYCLYIIQDN